ncbi:hypothetical protein I4U23_014795 [Adineta vaga]|nr:hypothetical protein I4U23_014795 [Adineta vaga]
MKYIVNCVLLISIAIYSSGRPLSEWTPTADVTLIDECLKKSLHRINNDQNVEYSQSDAKDIVCATHIEDGLHIKLSFTLERQRWECALYKLNVETLSIQTDKCEQVEDDNQQKNQPSSDNDQEVDDEAEIDKMNQQNQNTNDDNEEHDDEAEFDKTNQQIQNTNDDEEHDDEADFEKESNSNAQNVENDHEKDSNKSNDNENNDQVSEQKTAIEEKNTEVNNEGEDNNNTNKEGEETNNSNEGEDTNTNNE